MSQEVFLYNTWKYIYFSHIYQNMYLQAGL